MKLQTTLTFGLALALLGPAGGKVAAEPLATAAPGQPPAVAQGAPVGYAVAAAPPVGYAGYGVAPQPYAYPAAPAAPTAPAAATAAAPFAGGQYPVYPPMSATPPAVSPVAATTPATPPALGLGGYPTPPPAYVAANHPAPQGAAAAVAAGAPAASVAPDPTHGYPAAGSWSSYAAPPSAGCATGDCGPAVHAGAPVDPHGCGADACGPAYGAASCGTAACDLSGVASGGSSRQWFIGLYGLLLDRDSPGKAITAVEVQAPPAAGDVYYPVPGTDRFLATSDVDPDFRGGAEIRFGSTFGCAIDPCTGCQYQPFAWEIGYWGITDDPDDAVLIDVLGTGDADRIYGYQNYAGLEYNRTNSGLDADYRPLNDYFDFQRPIDGDSTNDIRVLAVRVRQNFEAQNLELNLWRFGSPSGGYATAVGGGGLGGGRIGAGGLGAGGFGGARGGGCGSGCGTGACGSSCGYDTCGCDCAPCAAPKRFFISGLAGLRYFRLDDTLQSAVSFTNTSIPTDPTEYPGGFPLGDELTIFDEIDIDNELVGFQIGCSLNRLVGCRWTLFCDSNFGIYNNNIDSYQRVFAGGAVRFVSDQSTVAIRSSKSDIAFLGELRAGVGYQVSSRARLTAAWRAIAASGIASAVGQVQTDFAAPSLAAHINSNDSLILHGLQVGVETKF